MTAGANLDPVLCVQEWPTLITGVIGVIGIKTAVILVAGEFVLGLSRGEAARVALLLAGGGEFAFVVFKLAENLGVLPDTLAKLLTAAVILSMALTPLLGDAAAWFGNQLDLLEKEDETKTRANALFDAIDIDGSGGIDPDELRGFLTGDGASRFKNPSFDDLFAKLDLNTSGEIERDELAKGYVELCLEQETVVADQAEPETKDGMKTASDAVVVCGYGEMGQRVCEALAAATNASDIVGVVAPTATEGQAPTEETKAPAQNDNSFIAFDRNPSRVSVGLLNNVRVVYGDGASSDLLKAAGITAPRAIAITFSNPKRCLEATRRLREKFPDTPIYVRSHVANERDELLEAGATQVVVENLEAAVQMSGLLGVDRDAREMLRQCPADNEGVDFAWPAGQPMPFSEGEIRDIASECGISISQVVALFEVYTSMDENDDGEVELAEIRDMLMRMSGAPIDDEALESWMAEADADGSGTLDFAEYVRISSKASSMPTVRVGAF